MNRRMPFVVASIIVVLAPSIASANPIVTQWEIDWRQNYIKEHFGIQAKLTEKQKWQMSWDMLGAFSKQQKSNNPGTPIKLTPVFSGSEMNSPKMFPKWVQFMRFFTFKGTKEEQKDMPEPKKKPEEIVKKPNKGAI